ncbi:hypothetical protein F5I97DRAFT_1973003 [Phlebopus sp. FC_14]|nr:hypothetical protein F5I97DRAFT_1973003 [Phlebopus sp. FC_14]
MGSRSCWNPKKRRSSAQAAHTQELSIQRGSQKENLAPETCPSSRSLASNDTASQSSSSSSVSVQLKALTKDLRNAIRRESHAKRTAEEARKRARETDAENKHVSARVEATNDSLRQRSNQLSKQLARAPGKTKRAVKKAVSKAVSKRKEFTLKMDGVITDTTRDLVHDLVAKHNVPVSSVNGTIEAVASAAGLEVKGEVSERSVGRIMLEADVAATVQLADEITRSKGITLSSDGTTHKNTTYQSHHITFSQPDGTGPVTRFAGILHEINHTSETQLQGWQEQLTTMCQVHNECMGDSLDWREFLDKVKGMLTDHAEDQKKLMRLFIEWKKACEREIQGERALACLPSEDITEYTWKTMEKLIEEAGGLKGWEALPKDEQQKRTETARHMLHHKIGVERFASLSPAEQEATDFFVWAGCCMHKELNAMNGVELPIILMNRDNTAAAASGVSAVTSCTLQVSGCGAVKALDLTGSVFRHKDDKKGQQDSLHYYVEAQLGYFLPWPDMSNTRYQSHCDGASAWLVYRPLYVPYLEIIRDCKDSRTFTNIERNVYNAFNCPKTAEEMACLSIWENYIGHPYMRQVRGQSRDFSNLLELGPLHSKLTIHLNGLISNPALILSPDATYHTAALDGKPFERPEAFYIVQKMAQDDKTYPHLRPLLVSFLQGATKTLGRFTSEFAPAGTITKSTPTQCELACMETTNDANEGALGTFRITLRRAPRMSLAQFNARFKYRKNQTGKYIKTHFSHSHRKYLHKKARDIQAMNLERKRRLRQVAYDRQVVEKHRLDDRRKEDKNNALAAEFAAYIPRMTEVELTTMKVTEIDFQIRWHRRFDALVPKAKDLPKKKEKKLTVLREAVQRYSNGAASPHDVPESRQDLGDSKIGCRGDVIGDGDAYEDEL